MPETQPKPRSLHWIALGLLVVSIAINYADRGSLGVAAASLQRELRLRPNQLGVLLSAFSVTYSLAQLFAGKLLDRWNVNWLYAVAFLLWSAATGATGLVSGFWSIFLLRLILGVAESTSYPAYSKMIVTSFPEQLRGTANGLIDAGSKLGPAIGVLLGVKMVGWFSWRGMFLVMGGASLIWLVPWCLVAGRLPGKVIHTTPAASWSASYKQMFSNRVLWGTAIGLFGGNYAWFFALNWLPYYFEHERHYTHDRLAIMGSLPFWAVAVSSMSFGLFADWLIRRGHRAGRVRQTFVCAGLTGCGALMFSAVLVKDVLWSNLLLIAAFIFMGAWSSNHWAFSQLLAGPETAGRWTGVQNCLGNLAGIFGPAITGFALQATHSFFAAFAIACGLLIIGVLGYWIVVGKPACVFPNPHVPLDGNLAYIGNFSQPA